MECAGTAIFVVTPAGEVEMTPGAVAAAALVVLDGATEAGGAFGPPAEQLATADMRHKTAAAQTGGQQWRVRTRSIYAKLAAVTKRIRFWECCRP